MKIARPLQVFFALAIVSLSIPVFLGHIPSMPRKSGHGWAPEIDMRVDPAGFWSYEGWAAFTWLMIFFMYLLVKRGKGELHRPARK